MPLTLSLKVYLLSNNVEEKILHGTTTVGIKAKDGVVLCADMRASAGYFIANNNTQKHIINIVVLMIGIVENQLNIVSYDDRTSSHYITHSIPDGRLFEWCNLRPYIDLNFSLVTKTTSKRVYKADSSYDTYFNGTECLIIKSSSFSNFQTAIGLQFSNEIRKYFDLENNGNYKYWLWDDYKNIIELSSYIE